MKIAIGTDHRGFLHKEFIKKNMPTIDWIDVGTYNQERTDYPIFADQVVDLVTLDEVNCGILLCASGTGMAIAANRHKYIYAAVVWNEQIARSAKEDDNANILVLPSDFVSVENSVILIQEWLSHEFKEGRYAQRLSMIDSDW